MPPSPVTNSPSSLESALSALESPSATLPPAPSSIMWSTNSSNSFWSGSGGPALIIVFVAVGLLAGAFAALLIARRAAPRPPIYDGNGSGWFFTSSRPPVLGAEPRLYEANLDDVKGGAAGEGCNWNEIMPLSAQFYPDSAASEVETPAIRPPPARLSPLVRFYVAMRDYYVPPRPEGEEEFDDESSVETHVDEKWFLESPADGKLHIAVAIAMPSQSTSLYYSDSSPSPRLYGDDTDEKDLIEEVPIIQVPRTAPAVQPRRAPESLREIYLGLAEVRTSDEHAS